MYLIFDFFFLVLRGSKNYFLIWGLGKFLRRGFLIEGKFFFDCFFVEVLKEFGDDR